MKYLVLLLSLAGATCLGAQPVPGSPAGVDGLTPEDVAKAVSAIKENYVRPGSLSDVEMERATLQGLLDRLAPAVSLVIRSGSGAEAETASPFYSEAYDANTGYLRVGKLTGENVEKTAEMLKAWKGKGVGAAVLDLRGTAASSDYDDAAGLAGLFCAKGTELFSLTAPSHEGAHPGPNSASGLSPTQTRTFSAGADPLFKGILVVLVDADTAEAPEAVAAVLQQCAKALVVGDKTAGRAYQFSDVPLNGALLRVAVAEVILADGKEPGENGLRPDIIVGIGPAGKKEVMRSITAKGVASVTNEHDRPHLNEAALVSGSNPEVDELEAEQSGQKKAAGLIDRQLQRALDLVTSISIFRAKGG